MYKYRIYGWNVETDIEIPFLVTNTEEYTSSDVVVEKGLIPADFKARHLDSRSWFSEKEIWLNTISCYMYVTNGNHLLYEVDEECHTTDLLTSFIIGYGFSLVALERNEIAMHCSAVRKGDKAFLVCGNSGSGKSTTTEYLLRNGYSLMADDVAILDVRENEVYVKPAFPYQKLCKDVAVKKGLDLSKYLMIDEEREKYMVPYEGEFVLHPVKLCGIICLIKRDEGELLIEEARGFNKWFGITENLFTRSIVEEKRYKQGVGEVCLKIASLIPMLDVLRPADKDTFDAVCERITEFLEGC